MRRERGPTYGDLNHAYCLAPHALLYFPGGQPLVFKTEGGKLGS